MKTEEGRARPDVLAGARVRLRPSTTADAHVVALIAGGADVARCMPWGALTDDAEAHAFLRARVAGGEAGREGHWMIEALDTREPIGLLASRFEGVAADVRVVLAPHAWGRGHATDACATLVAWLKSAGFARIWAETDPGNRRAVAVLERAGLVREGVLRGAAARPGVDGLAHDALVFALCVDEA